MRSNISQTLRRYANVPSSPPFPCSPFPPSLPFFTCFSFPSFATGPSLRFKLPSTWLITRAEREPIMGVWGWSPSGVQRQSPWSGGQWAKPPEAESFSAFQRPPKAAKFTPLTVSDKMSVCDVSTTLSRIPNTSLRKTGGLKQLMEMPPGDGFQKVVIFR